MTNDPLQDLSFKATEPEFRFGEGKISGVLSVFLGSLAFAAVMALPTGEATKLSSLDELDEWNVPDRLKLIIVEGELDEPKQGDNSPDNLVWLM